MKGTRGSGRVSRGVTAMALLAMLGMAGPAALAQQAKLGFFKNYFVTGDYVAAGVALQQKGVNGIATGRIRIEPSQIPADAEIVAAFLYFQIISTSDKPDPAMLLKDARFKGNPIGDYAFLVSDAGSAPCWSSGGGTGGTGTGGVGRGGPDVGRTGGGRTGVAPRARASVRAPSRASSSPWTSPMQR